MEYGALFQQVHTRFIETKDHSATADNDGPFNQFWVFHH